MTFLDNLSPEDALILTNAIAIALSKDKTAVEIALLGNFIVGVGCLMITVAAQRAYLDTFNQPNQNAPGDDIIN